MKKLLTIMVLALALCLVCSAALAADEAYAKASDYPIGAPITVDGTPYTVVDNQILEAHTKDRLYNTMRVYYTTAGDYKDFFVNLHDIDGAYTVTKAATCWEAGSYEVKCSVCGYVTKLTIPAGEKVKAAAPHETEANGHTHISKIKTEADCQHEGVSATWCTTCKSFKPDSDVATQPKTSHVYTMEIEVQPYTCMTKKAIWYEACKNCGMYKGEDEGKPRSLVEHSITNLAAYNIERVKTNYVPLKNFGSTYDGHDWNAWSLDKAATCYRPNVYIRWCKNGCHTTQETDGPVPQDPFNHKLAPVWVVDPKANVNCMSTAVDFVCSICGGDATGHKKAGTVDTATGEVKDPDGFFSFVLPHEYKVSNAYLVTKADAAGAGLAKRDDTGKVAATCTVGAYREYKCIHESEAGHKALGKYDLLRVEVADEPALGHKWGAWSVSTAVDENGNHYYWRQCERCSKVEREFDNVPAELCEEHDFEVTTEPTCTEAGEKTCKKCGTTEEVAALGHDWDETIKKAATCKEEGLKNRVCKRCGTGETDIKIEKLAHTWDEGKITKEATKEAKGEKTFTCTVCGETKTEEVEYVITAAPKYTMTASYNGTAVTGKLVHDEDTLEAPVKFVRVTFYVEGNYYMATMAEVEADGTFSVDGVGPIVYITAVATGNSSVNPEDVKVIAPAVEIFVK